MNIVQLPLKERLERIDDAYAGHPEYDRKLIQNLGAMPLTEYFRDLDAEREDLLELLRAYRNPNEPHTYAQAAVCVDKLRSTNKAAGNEAVRLLVAPLVDYCERKYPDGEIVA